MVDEEIVVEKLRQINEYTHDLTQMRGIPEDDVHMIFTLIWMSRYSSSSSSSVA